MRVLLVAVGGAAGALGRYAVSLLGRGATFPWTTLTINLLGSLLLGLLLGAAAEGRVGRLPLLAVGVGFLGAFTTFSGWALESRRRGLAGLGLGLVAVWLGRLLT